MMIPTEHEIEALRMLNGDVPMQGGAWLNACCEFLQEGGYVTRMPYRGTDKGKQFLSALPTPAGRE